MVPAVGKGEVEGEGRWRRQKKSDGANARCDAKVPCTAQLPRHADQAHRDLDMAGGVYVPGCGFALTHSAGQIEEAIWRTPLQASSSPSVPLRQSTHSLYLFLGGRKRGEAGSGEGGMRRGRSRVSVFVRALILSRVIVGRRPAWRCSDDKIRLRWRAA